MEEISQQFFGALGARMVPKSPIFADDFTYFTVVKKHVTMSSGFYLGSSSSLRPSDFYQFQVHYKAGPVTCYKWNEITPISSVK